MENYDAVIDGVEVCSTYYLDVKDNNLSSLKIYPNPFSSEIKIDSKIEIKNYYLIDILGQLVINTDSLQNLNSKLQIIKSGIYFIKLESNANVYETRKIIKL